MKQNFSVIIMLLQCNWLSLNALDRKPPVLPVQVKDKNQYKYPRVQDKTKALEHRSADPLSSTTALRHSEGLCADTQCESVQWDRGCCYLSPPCWPPRSWGLDRPETNGPCYLPFSPAAAQWSVKSQTLHLLAFNPSQKPGM